MYISCAVVSKTTVYSFDQLRSFILNLYTIRNDVAMIPYCCHREADNVMSPAFGTNGYFGLH